MTDALLEKELGARMKAELRKRMRGLRKTASAELRATWSEAIGNALDALPILARARRVAAFWPMADHGEVDVLPWARRATERGVELAFPRVSETSESLDFYVTPLDGRWTESAFGLREPDPTAAALVAPGGLDALVVPALAVDPTGRRLGYGRGYYDRSLPRFAPPAAIVVVAFDFQLVVELPNMPHDVRGHVVVTDKRILEASG